MGTPLRLNRRVRIRLSIPNARIEITNIDWSCFGHWRRTKATGGVDFVDFWHHLAPFHSDSGRLKWRFTPERHNTVRRHWFRSEASIERHLGRRRTPNHNHRFK